VSRSLHQRRPTRRALAVAAAIVALVVPFASAFADVGGPPEPSGRSFSMFTVFVCGASSCTSVELDIHDPEGSGSLDVCLSTLTLALDMQTIVGQELGCAEGAIGPLLQSGGFITGVQPTSVTLSSDAGSRTVTVSASSALSGAIKVTSETVQDATGPCTITWTIKERSVGLAGTVVVDGVSYAANDALSTIRQVKEKTRC
jgi:hypothetical protein